MKLYEKWDVSSAILKDCKTSTDLIRLFKIIQEDEEAPCFSERTARRIMAEYRKEKSLSYFDSKETSDEERPTVYPGVLQAITEDTECIKPGVQGTYIITCAQPGTQVHAPFLGAIHQFCNHRGARLIVGGCAHGRKPKGGYKWDSRIQQQLGLNSTILSTDLVWNGELSLLVTASDPVSALDAYNGASSGIFPHPQQRMKSLPHNGIPRFNYTTGCVTLRNYTPTKTGHTAAHKHVYGALVVEVTHDGDWFVRQVQADDDGGFYDLNWYYTEFNASCITDVAHSITWGDVHFPNEHPDFWEVFHSMSRELGCVRHFIHDVYDFHVRNHHTIHDHHDMFKKFVASKDNVFYELCQCADRIKRMTDDYNLVYVVPSNHEEALVKWLKGPMPTNDYTNIEFYIKAQGLLYDYISDERQEPFLEYLLMRMNMATQAKWVFDGDSCGQVSYQKVIWCGMHGHHGINGAKASLMSYVKTGEAYNLGHSHSAGIMGDVYQAGTSTALRLNYNKGLSTWSNSHIVMYKNDARTIITTRGTRWKL